MKYAALVLALAGGFGLGWLVRDRTYDAPTERSDSDRTFVAEETQRRERAEQVAREAVQAREKALFELAEVSKQLDASKVEAKDAEARAAFTGIDKKQLDQMIKGMATQWKGFATVAAKRDLKTLLEELGFDEETAKKIEAAVEADVDRSMEQTAYAMFGEGEMDPNTFLYFMGLPGELSTNLERELATFLDDRAIGDVRAGFQKQSKEAMDRMANAQIAMMSIPDLSDDQSTRIRELLSDGNMFEKQMRQFAEVTRDKKKFAALMEGKVDLETELRRGMDEQREQMRGILTPEQFKNYETYETQQIAQQQMGIKMMQSMFKAAK